MSTQTSESGLDDSQFQARISAFTFGKIYGSDTY